jgi:glycosyltransferase 2 family protein
MATPVATDPPRARRSHPARRQGGPAQRQATDLVRVVLGLAVLGVGFLLARRGELSLFETNLFRLLNDLPGIVYPLVWLVMQLGNVVTVPVLAAVALLARQVRMARDILVSGLLAYALASYVKGVVGRARPAGFDDVDAVFRDGTVSGIGFISGHSAVAAALAAAAAPYLSRRGRRVAWTLAWAVALSRVYVGAHLPLDVVGGVAAGWAVGALVHWVFGVPRWHPDAERVGRLLERLGLPVHDLRVAGVEARSSHPFDGTDDRGRRVYVKVLDPDRFERDWLYRLYRVVAVRDIKDADAVAPLDRQAEHEAVAAMTAREAGVRVPPVLFARGDAQGAVVVQRYVEGRPLDAFPPEELTPALLTAVWQQVGLLRSARIAHHDLVASSVLVDADGEPWVVGFGNAVNGADDDQLAQDVAELMASLSLRLEPQTVVESAVAGLGADAVAAAVPGLAPLSLSLATRTGLRSVRPRLGALRREVHRVVGLPDADRPQVTPGRPAARLLVAAGAVTAIVGVPMLAGATALVESVEAGGWRWLGGALALAVLARAAMGLAVMATTARRLALGRVFLASLVADGASLLRGRSGWRTAMLRFLQRAGVLPEPSRRAVDRFLACSAAAAVLVAIVTLVLALVEGALTDWEAPEALVPSVLLGLGAWLLVLAGRYLAGRDSPGPVDGPAGPVRRAVAGGGFGKRRVGPRRWGAVMGWSALGVGLEAAALASAVHAVGSGLPLLETVSVYALVHMIWTVLPVTAAPGAADVGLLLALTALGAPLASACAAVVVFRLLTYWLPAVPGSLLGAQLERRLVL